MSINEGIQVECIETCLVCGAKGVLLYPDMRDKLFGAAGIWSHLRCPVDGHVWLNPRPIIEDIAKVYTTYYTHDLASDRQSFLAALKSRAEDALLNTEFGYHTIPSGLGSRLIGRLISLLPMAKEIAGSKLMWLNAHPNGKLLDVGCGNGSFLAGMKKLGWNVSGVEPDASAATIAMDRLAVPIAIGTLGKANFSDNSFDAVTAHHVIEHMHDPMGFLRESLRILKPGGKLVVTTPNVASWGHRVFRMSWRELDAPRHLHIFSPRTIRICAEEVGFTVETLRTTARSTWEIWCASSLIRRDGSIQGVFPRHLNLQLRLKGLAVQLFQHMALHFKDNIGEGIVLIASKPSAL